MEIVGAQFSVKFLRQTEIRRRANKIEDILSGEYSAPQVFSMPDDFAADAPRIILVSLNGHSQIMISQISIDFVVNFDGDFVTDFNKTKEYVTKKIELISNLLDGLDIEEYCYCGVMYNINVDSSEKPPVEYMSDQIGKLGKITEGKLYDANYRKSYIIDNHFINEQVGIVREFEEIGNISPDLFDLVRSKVKTERLGVMIDINNRYGYANNDGLRDSAGLGNEVNEIYVLLEAQLNKWGLDG